MLVVCLCAAWCTTCNEFRGTFDKLAQARPDLTFRWIDIEDDAALVGDIEFDNFPTLAVFRGDVPLFYGVTTPQEGVVARTLAHLGEAEREAITVPDEIADLPGAIRARE